MLRPATVISPNPPRALESGLASTIYGCVAEFDFGGKVIQGTFEVADHEHVDGWGVMTRSPDPPLAGNTSGRKKLSSKKGPPISYEHGGVVQTWNKAG